MTIKISGTRTVLSDIYETICDVCSKKIKECYHYPKYELEITSTKYLADGDQPDYYHFCSLDCLYKFVEKKNS